MNFQWKKSLSPSPFPTRLGEASGLARVGWERVVRGAGFGICR